MQDSFIVSKPKKGILGMCNKVHNKKIGSPHATHASTVGYMVKRNPTEGMHP